MTTRQHRIRNSSQWNASKKKFSNRLPAGMHLSKMGFALSEYLFKKANHKPATLMGIVEPKKEDFPPLGKEDLLINWLGHSTLILQIGGLRVLLDPVWSERVSFLKRLGPKRFHKPPIPFQDLPAIDVIVISHDHYDHLDRESIEYFSKHSEVFFLLPLGVGVHFEKWGIPSDRYEEFDWWENKTIKGVTFTAAPARHSSGRNGRTDQSLWCSWAIESRVSRAFFGGDSAMHHDFPEIRERLGPFDLTMLEVGAYHPAWSFFHMGPEQSVDAHLQLGGKVYLPIHWGTFNLAPHSWIEPIERAILYAKERGVNFITPRPGEIVNIDTIHKNEYWWPRNIDWRTRDELPIISTNLDL